MTDLLDIQDKLSATNSAISQAAQILSRCPNDRAATLNIRSLEKRQRNLEEVFLSTAEAQQVDVCSYRIIPANTQQVTLGTLAKVLGDFQDWLSLAFHAVKNGPQSRKRVPRDIAENTALGFAYAYPGSVGFVLTLTNEQLLFGDTELDKAINAVMNMAKERTPEGIRSYARQFGVAPIRAMNSWAEHHVESHVAVNIDWHRGAKIKSDLMMQSIDFVQLHAAISATSDTTEKTYSGTAELIGIDVVRRSFHVRLPTGNEISGKFSADLAINEEYSVEVPREYDVRILTRTTINYAIEDETIVHILQELVASSS